MSAAIQRVRRNARVSKEIRNREQAHGWDHICPVCGKNAVNRFFNETEQAWNYKHTIWTKITDTKKSCQTRYCKK